MVEKSQRPGQEVRGELTVTNYCRWCGVPVRGNPNINYKTANASANTFLKQHEAYCSKNPSKQSKS